MFSLFYYSLQLSETVYKQQSVDYYVMPSGGCNGMLERRPEFQNYVQYFIYLSIYLSISCLKLTHSFNFFNYTRKIS